MGASGTGPDHLADPGKLARSASGIPVVPAFDGYRAFAILGVVLLHVLNLSGVIQSGDSGPGARLVWGTIGHSIDVLFVVSGFVVFLPTAARQGRFGSIGAYAIRRASRLFPAYWAILAICLILIWLTTVSPDVADPPFDEIGLHFAGIVGPAGMFIPGLATGFGVDPPLWTLGVEIAFYVVLPLVAGLYFRHPLAGLAAAGVITVGWNLAFEHIGGVSSGLGFDLSDTEQLRLAVTSSIQLPSWAFSFGLGMTGAWAYVKWWRAARSAAGRQGLRRLTAIAVAGLAVFAWVAGGYSDRAPFDLVAEYSRFTPSIAIGYSAFLAASMVLIAMGTGFAQRPFSNPTVRQLGDISYGIYLCHMVIAFYAGSVLALPSDGTVGALAIWLAVIVPASVAYGYLSARFLEQPVRRWARRFGRRVDAD
jgi:peptidoglycan/LPS O-acetylase OafA/YrhL